MAAVDSRNFVAVSRRLLSAEFRDAGVTIGLSVLDAESQSLAYALAEVAGARIEEVVESFSVGKDRGSGAED